MYNYKEHRKDIFTTRGIKRLLEVRDKTMGYKRHQFSLGTIVMGIDGDSWAAIACLDFLVEIGEIREVNKPHNSIGQYRMFVRC